MILVLHQRYRTSGGEERAVEDHLWLVREYLGEPAELLERDSALLGRPRAAVAMLRGGLEPDDVASAIRRTGARIVHAHNLNPSWGWRGLAAARAAGARTVLHLHNYRLVCAVGTCFTRGGDCTRCHGRDTWPGVRLRCRGPALEAGIYGAGLALWQRRLAAQADRFAVPSAFALERLRSLGAPLGTRARLVGHAVRTLVASPRGRRADGYALVAGRLAAEKGVDVAIEACAHAGLELVVAGDGPQAPRLRALARGRAVRFVGRVDSAELDRVREGAALALAPSRSAETFGLAAAEAMAAGLPVAASRIGALPELVPAEALAAPGDALELARAIARLRADPHAGARALAAVAARAAPARVAASLSQLYAELDGLREGRGD